MKKYLKFIVPIAIIGLAYGFYEYNRGHQSTAKIQADHTVSAAELFREFEENEETANAKYLDKVVEVSGEISKISAEDPDKKSISLKSDDMIFGIIGELDPAVDHQLSELNEGENIVIKGICTGMLSDVVLVRCVVK